MYCALTSCAVARLARRLAELRLSEHSGSSLLAVGAVSLASDQLAKAMMLTRLGRGTCPMSQTAPVLALSRLLSDNSRLIVSDVVEAPVDLRSLFSKSVSPAMYKAELRRHVEHVRWYLEHPTEARALSQSRTTSSARSGHASSATTCSNSGILHQRSG